jgi:predicted nucleic acid-binding protein
MVSYLLDTNVLSELRKGRRADAGVRAWFADIADEHIFLSVLVIGEIRRGIELIRRRDAAAATQLDAWLRRLVEAYEDRMLPIDLAVAEVWARLHVPDPIPVVDGLLAATAHLHGLTLVTRNTKAVQGTGVPFLDPFEG